ncbi:MAG: 16S rRNA methyltransferase [Thermofilaceae archaeon]
MEKLHLLLAEAGLELVPAEIWGHPTVAASARKRGKEPGEILLDVSLHYAAMKGLKDRMKRGRPDIAHFCMLLALGSLLNRAEMLELYVHTYDGRMIGVSPHVRLPRNYNRFVGLVEQLLKEGRVPPNSASPLLWVEPYSLEELLERVAPSRIFLLSEKGGKVGAAELARRVASEPKPMVVVGCFQAGDFSERILKLAHEVVSISQYALDAWAATAKVLSAIEDALNLF